MANTRRTHGEHTANTRRTHGFKLLNAGSVMVALLSSLFVGLLTAPTVSAHATQRKTPTSSASTATCLQPPANVDLTTLSNAQLAVYGLPSRARYQGRLAFWKKMIQHAKHRYCGPLVNLNNRVPSEGFHKRFTSEEDNDRWAGNMAIGGGYDVVDGTWSVPCISTSSHRPADVAQWVGLGGDAQDYPNQSTPYHTLDQAGTTSTINSDGSFSYYAWFEDVPYDAKGIPTYDYSSTFVINCADYMYVYVDSNLSYSRHVFYYFEDYSQGWYFPYEEGNGSYSYLTDGSSAEWIVERTRRSPIFRLRRLSLGLHKQYEVGLASTSARRLTIMQSCSTMIIGADKTALINWHTLGQLSMAGKTFTFISSIRCNGRVLREPKAFSSMGLGAL